MSTTRRPNLVLCAPRDSRIETLREQLAAHPAIAWSSPDEAGRLDKSATSALAQDSSFDLLRPTDEGDDPAEPNAESGRRYFAWQPQRFIEFPVVQWNVAHHLQGAKLVFCLRDPIDLAHLRYLAYPDEMPGSLEEAIVECEATMAELGAWSYRGAWPRYFADPSQLSLLLQGGVYATPLERCYRLLDRGQIHCVIYEEFRSDPGRILTEIWQFLGLPAPEPVAGVDPGSGSRLGHEPLPPPVRTRLEEFYAEHNARLARLLGGIPAAWS